jgi:chromosome segregation ATPase
MQRVYAVVREEIVHRVDDRAKVMGITRSQWIGKAIDAFLHPSGDDKIAPGDGMITHEVTISQAQESKPTTIGDHLQGDDKITQGDDQIILGDNKVTQEVTILKARLDESIAEVDHLKGDLLVKEDHLLKLKTDVELKWRETMQLRAEISQARRELEGTKARAMQLQAELDKRRDEAEEARSQADALQKDLSHFQDTVSMKDKQIGFLEGHIAQLTQSISQLSLKPGEEEIKKKGWWQFWK